jgi:hypothetical protein
MKYVMVHWLDEAALPEPGSAEEVAFDQELNAWDAEMESRGILAGGARLEPLTTRTVCVRNGEVLVTDGPFAETKEQIAGLVLLECKDMDEAIEVSSRHPTGRIGTFELRPITATDL